MFVGVFAFILLLFYSIIKVSISSNNGKGRDTTISETCVMLDKMVDYEHILLDLEWNLRNNYPLISLCKIDGNKENCLDSNSEVLWDDGTYLMCSHCNMLVKDLNEHMSNEHTTVEPKENDIYMPDDSEEFDSEQSSCSAVSESLSNIVERVIEVPDPQGMVNIEKVSPSKEGTKKYFCKFCQKMVSKLVRHLECVHKSEKEVIAFSLLPKGCQERKKIIELIRNAGSFLYNTNSSYNKGNLLVSRRPQSHLKRKPTHFECCPKCKGTYSKLTLRHHVANCLKPAEKTDKSIMVMSKRVRAAVHSLASSVVKDSIFPYLREDDTVNPLHSEFIFVRHTSNSRVILCSFKQKG